MSDTIIRRIRHTDLPAVLAIESVSSEFPWTRQNFIDALTQRHCVGLLAENQDNKVVGYAVYHLTDGEIVIRNLVVAPSYRRLGFGRSLVEKLAEKLSQERRRRALMVVRESNQLGLLFLKACGFRAAALVQGFFNPQNPDDDAVVMTLDASPRHGLPGFVGSVAAGATNGIPSQDFHMPPPV